MASRVVDVLRFATERNPSNIRESAAFARVLTQDFTLLALVKLEEGSFSCSAEDL